MNDDLLRVSSVFWPVMSDHLWQSSWVLVFVALLARGMRGAPAGLVAALWWTALIKFFLPLDLLGAWAGTLARTVGAMGQAEATSAAGWVGVTVLFRAPIPTTAAAPDAVFAWLTLVWLAGAIGLAWKLRPRRIAQRRPASSGTRAETQKIRDAISGSGISERWIDVTSDQTVPSVVGIVHPRIVIPLDLVRRLATDDLRAVLLHEDAHRRRRDPARACLTGCAAILFFFYPPIWWLIRRVGEATEMACDEAVLAAGVPSETYSRALAHALRLGLASHGVSSALHGRGSSQLSRRLHRLRHARRFVVMPRHRALLALAFAAVLVSSILPLSPAATSDTDARTFVGLSRLNGADSLVTTDFDGVAVEEVLRVMSKTGSFRLRIEGALPGQRVTLHLKNDSLRRALEKLAQQAGLRYEVGDPAVLTVHCDAPRIAGSNGVTNPQLVFESKVEPVYPESMRAAKLEGSVILQAIVEESGEVSEIDVLKTTVPDHPEMAESAVTAIRQWRYEPATVDGEPVRVYFTVFVDFKLH